METRVEYVATSDRAAPSAPDSSPGQLWLAGLALAATALGFGYASNQVPPWEFLSADTMWINELAAPYAALVCGVVFGLLGRRWVLRREPWVAGTVALLTVLEAAAFATGLSGVDVPAMNLYPPTYPWTAWNFAFWFVEASCGVLLAVLLVRWSRHRGSESFPIAERRGR